MIDVKNKRFDKVLEFDLGELYNLGDIEAFDDLIEAKAGAIGGILSDISFEPIGVREGLIQIRVQAGIEEY